MREISSVQKVSVLLLSLLDIDGAVHETVDDDETDDEQRVDKED